MDKEKFLGLRQKVIDAGYGAEITWQEEVLTCDDADSFFREYMWVVLSSGIKNQVARLIEGRIYKAIDKDLPISTAFRHKGKVKAIEYVKQHRHQEFARYKTSTNVLEFFVTLPWIGHITKYHLAKNLGLDVVKPDRHLVRIASSYGKSPLELCEKLARETGYRIGTVDLIIWRAANLGFI